MVNSRFALRKVATETELAQLLIDIGEGEKLLENITVQLIGD